MSNLPIYSNSMEGMADLISGMQKKVSNSVSNLSYKEMLKSMQSADETESTGETKSTADMTMEEYQSYIWEKIDSFPFSPTRINDEETIKISSKCWERMKNDPEYEDKMMNIIKDGRAYPDPFAGMGSKGTYWVLEFDGGEGCMSHGFSKNYGGSEDGARNIFNKESEGSFWSSRARKAKAEKEILEAYYQKKDLLEKMAEQKATAKAIQAHKMGLVESGAEMPIMGVPAEFLLAGLMGGGMMGE